LTTSNLPVLEDAQRQHSVLALILVCQQLAVNVEPQPSYVPPMQTYGSVPYTPSLLSYSSHALATLLTPHDLRISEFVVPTFPPPQPAKHPGPGQRGIVWEHSSMARRYIQPYNRTVIPTLGRRVHSGAWVL